MSSMSLGLERHGVISRLRLDITEVHSLIQPSVKVLESMKVPVAYWSEVDNGQDNHTAVGKLAPCFAMVLLGWDNVQGRRGGQ